MFGQNKRPANFNPLNYFPGGMSRLVEQLGTKSMSLKSFDDLIEQICSDPKLTSSIIEWRDNLKKIEGHEQFPAVVNLIGSLTLKSTQIKHIGLDPHLETMNSTEVALFFSAVMPKLIEESFLKHQISVFSLAYFDTNMNLIGSKEEILLSLDLMMESIDKLEKMAHQHEISIFRVGSLHAKHVDTEISNKLIEFYAKLVSCEVRTSTYKQYRLNLAANFNCVDLSFAAHFTPLGSNSHFKRLTATQFASTSPDLLIQCNTENVFPRGHRLFDSAKYTVPLKDISACDLNSEHVYKAAVNFAKEMECSTQVTLRHN